MENNDEVYGLKVGGENPSRFSQTQNRVIEALALIPKAKPLIPWYEGSLIAYADLRNPDRLAQAAHSLRELVEKLVKNSLTVPNGPSGREVMEKLKSDFSKLKEQCSSDSEQNWTGLGDNLDEVGRFMDSLDDYLNNQTSRRERISAHFSDTLRRDPLAGVAESQWEKYWVNKLTDASAVLEAVAHHKNRASEQDFDITRATIDRAIITLSASYQFEADDVAALDCQREISDLMSLSEISPDNLSRLVELVGAQDANRSFAFKRINTIGLLYAFCEAGLFNLTSSHTARFRDREVFRYSHEMSCLMRMAPGNERAVALILSKIEPVGNSLIQKQIVEILALLPADFVLPSLSGHLSGAVGGSARLIDVGTYAKLLPRLIHCEVSQRLSIKKVLLKLLSCEPDPARHKKEALYKEQKYSPSLEPLYVLDEQDYVDFIDRVIKPSIQIDAEWVWGVLQVAWAKVLCNSTLRPACRGDFDNTLHWCPEIGKQSESHLRACSLFNAIADSLHLVFSSSPEAARRIEGALSASEQLCYARLLHYVSAKTIRNASREVVIREIEKSPDYGRLEFTTEFDSLVRAACMLYEKDFLGRRLDGILASIKTALTRSFEGKPDVHCRRLAYRQMSAFRPVLPDEDLELLRSMEEASSSDDASRGKGPEVSFGSVESVSPISCDKMAAFSEEDLLAYINTWDSEGHGENYFIRVTRAALAEAFASHLRRIDGGAGFWGANWHRVQRLDFLTAALSKFYVPGCKTDFDKWFPGFLNLASIILSSVKEISARDASSQSTYEIKECCLILVECLESLVDSCVSAEKLDVFSSVEDVLVAISKIHDPDEFSDNWSRELVDRVSLNSFRCRIIRWVFRYFYALKSLEVSGAPSRAQALMSKVVELDKTISVPVAAVIAERFRTVLTEWKELRPGLIEAVFSEQNSLRRTYSLRSYLLRNNPHLQDLEEIAGIYHEAISLCESEVPGVVEPYVLELGSHLFVHYLWAKDSSTSVSNNWERYLGALKLHADVRGKLGTRLFHSLYSADKAFPLRVLVRCTKALRQLFGDSVADCQSGLGLLFSAQCIDPRLRMGLLIKYCHADCLGTHDVTLIVDELEGLSSQTPRASLRCLIHVLKPASALELVYFPKDNVLKIIDAAFRSGDRDSIHAARAYVAGLIRVGCLDSDDRNSNWPMV